MSALRFTLVSDGPSDAVLVHPLRWLLIANGVRRPVDAVWADLRQLPKPPVGLEARIMEALNLYPCDLLFIHRDAERESRKTRIAEIERAIQRVASDFFANGPRICVVPIRMTEAWFLFDEPAIRRAAGNPAGVNQLSLPPLQKVEALPDPKQVLQALLRDATELPPRRLRKFDGSRAFRRLGELIEDFSPLRALPAFAELESDVQAVVKAAGWAA